jgi:hypothetical protein
MRSNSLTHMRTRHTAGPGLSCDPFTRRILVCNAEARKVASFPQYSVGRDLADARLLDTIIEVHAADRGVYGARLIHAELRLGRRLARIKDVWSQADRGLLDQRPNDFTDRRRRPGLSCHPPRGAAGQIVSACLLHTDRASQFRSRKLQQTLTRHPWSAR